MKSLETIFRENMTDKYDHHYHEVYNAFFESRRNERLNILEVGIWKGLSHKAWLEYFPNAQVFGIDIFSRIMPKDVPILKHPRMHYLVGDSTNPEIKEQIRREWKGIKFDIIIDDGLHTPDANRKTFENLMMFFSDKFEYYIEDVWATWKMDEKELKHRWLESKKEEFTSNKTNALIFTLKSRFNVVEYDLRKKSGKPDSYLLGVEN